MTLDQKIRHWNHRRIDKMRAWKLWLARNLFGQFSQFIGDTESNQNILVLRLDGKVGDSVTATGFLRAIKQHSPQSRIIVATNQAASSVYAGLDFVDQVLISKKGIVSTCKLFKQLKSSDYKYIINTSHILTPQVVFLCSFLKAFRKIGLGNSSHNIATQKPFSDVVAIDFKKDHITDRYKKVLALIGVNHPDLSYQVKISSEAQLKAQNYIQDLRKHFKNIIVLNSFAGGRLRNFSQKTTQELVLQLLNRIPDSCVVSVANQGDHNILQQWIPNGASSKRDSEILRWSHNSAFSSLQDNMALLQEADLLISPDTAWVHIASAVNKKMVAVYREDRDSTEENSTIWAPYGAQFIIVKAPATGLNPDDINNVNVDAVVTAAYDLLHKKS